MGSKARTDFKDYLKGKKKLNYVLLPFDDEDQKILDKIGGKKTGAKKKKSK